MGYIYDGSFEGFLCCVYEVYYSHDKISFITSEETYDRETSGSLLPVIDHPKIICTNSSKADKVYKAIKFKISEAALETVYTAFLSELPNSEMMLLEYIKLGFKTGSNIENMLHDDRVMNLNRIERKVINECHRMLGFVRFSIVGNVYYCEYCPDHNITAIITPHFAERFKDQLFIIHDIKRNLASVYNKNEWYMTTLTKSELLNCPDFPIISSSANESAQKYETLWKNYFISTDIAERSNEKCQKNHMPVRYWKHLTEFS